MWNMIKIYPLKKQPKGGKKHVHGFFMDIFFLYINRGLVLYYFCSFALFQEMRTSSTSTLVRASYRWPMQGLGLSFGSKDVDNMIDTIVCEGCKVFFFLKASILGFHGFRRPNTNGSQFFLCTVAVGLRMFFFVLALCCSKTACAQNFLPKLEATPHLNGKHVFLARYAQQKGQKGSIECIQCITFAEDAKWNSHWTFA